MKETDHRYYCSSSNYYSNDPRREFETVTDFLDEMFDADIDMNLCFRFDIHKEVNETYYAEFFIIQQRKGVFMPVRCNSYNPEVEGGRLESYLKKHWNYMNNLWKPISVTKEVEK